MSSIMSSAVYLAIAAFVPLSIFLLRQLLGRRNRLDAQENIDKAHFWATVDNVGVPSNGGIHAQTFALLSSLTSVKSWVHGGYNTISKARELPFAFPTIWTWSNVVVLPPSALQVHTKPDSELRAFDAQHDTIQLPYMIGDREIYMNPIHFDVVRKRLVNPKDLASLSGATADEVDAVLDDVWGTSTEWETTNAWDACGRIILCAAIRILIGVPVCRNEDYFEQSRLFTDALLIGTAMINTLPPMLRPVIGPLFAVKAKYHQQRCLKILVPFVQDRIQKWEKAGRDGDESELPNDFLQWLIARCAKEGPEEMQPMRLANRLLTFNVMFVIGMVYVFGHCVIDLYSSPDREDILAGLAAECKQVSGSYNGLGSKEAVDRLYRIDSTIRESMRVSDVAVTALARDVVGKPLDLGNGIRIPRGTRVVYPTQAVHQDPDHYRDPLQFDAFRFSRPFEGISPQKGVDELGQNEENRLRLTTITPSFLAFGYGKHACPGRWFATQTMKQALAGIVQNYDIEITNRPSTRPVVLNMMVPPTGTQMRFRRKAKR